MALEKKKVGEDWTDSDEDFKTSGTLDSGDQTITGDADVSGTITGAVVMQGAEQVLDTSDLIPGTILNEVEIVNAGPSVPTSPFAGMFWYDTAANFLKVRNEANNAWLSIWDIANNKPVITNLSAEILTAMIANAQITQVKLSGIARGSLVSVDDTTMRYLNGALIAGDNISFTENNPGADETLTIDKLFKGAAVYGSGSQTIIDGVGDSIDFVSEIDDTDGFHEGITNPERITIPASVSRVRLSAQVTCTPAGSGSLDIVLQKNGTGFAGGCGIKRTSVPSEQQKYNFHSPVLIVSQSEYFELAVTWVADAAGDLIINHASALTWFAIEVVE